MKIMNIFHIIIAAAVLIAVQVDAAPKRAKNVQNEQVQPSAVEIEAAVDQVTDGVRENLENATSQAAEQITMATIAKNHAIAAGIEGSMTQDAVKAVVETQDAVIAKIKQDLMQLAENAVAVVDGAEKQASYASQFITGAQKFGSWIWNPAAEQERNLAQAIIIRLEEEKANTTNPAIIKQLDQQINDQKLITGDKMSTRQLLLIGAVTAAAAVAGVSLGSKYFVGSPVQELPGQESTNQNVVTVVADVQQTQNDIQQIQNDIQQAKNDIQQTQANIQVVNDDLQQQQQVVNESAAVIQQEQQAVGNLEVDVQPVVEPGIGSKIAEDIGRTTTKGVQESGKLIGRGLSAVKDFANQQVEDVKSAGRALYDVSPESVQQGLSNAKQRLLEMPVDYLTPDEMLLLSPATPEVDAGIEALKEIVSENIETLRAPTRRESATERKNRQFEQEQAARLSAKQEEPTVVTPIKPYTPSEATRGVESPMQKKNRENEAAANARRKAKREEMKAANKAKAEAAKAAKAAKAAAQ